MFGRKSKSKQAIKKSKDNDIIVTKYIDDKMSKIYNMIQRFPNGYIINLLAIGKDENDVTLQIRANKLNCIADLNAWIYRSVRKIEKLSWVEISIIGHDEDGDYCSRTFEFNDVIGDAFLCICYNAPVNETPLHKLLMVHALSK